MLSTISVCKAVRSKPLAKGIAGLLVEESKYKHTINVLFMATYKNTGNNSKTSSMLCPFKESRATA